MSNAVNENMIQAGVEAFRRNINTDIYEPIMTAEEIVMEIFASMMASAQKSD